MLVPERTCAVVLRALQSLDMIASLQKWPRKEEKKKERKKKVKIGGLVSDRITIKL